MTQRITDHASMTLIKAQDVMEPAERAQVAIGVTGELAALNVIDMTMFQGQHMSDSQLTAANTLGSISSPNSAACILPNFSGLSGFWHDESFAVLHCAPQCKA